MGWVDKGMGGIWRGGDREKEIWGCGEKEKKGEGGVRRG